MFYHMVRQILIIPSLNFFRNRSSFPLRHETINRAIWEFFLSFYSLEFISLLTIIWCDYKTICWFGKKFYWYNRENMNDVNVKRKKKAVDQAKNHKW